MKNSKNLQTLYHMRKSLLTLHRARHSALDVGDMATAKELKKCIDTVGKRIKLLGVRNEKNK